MIDKDRAAILKDLQTIHSDIEIISTKLVVVADWVRFKCRYGCRAYGKHLCCPPYAPSPEETRQVISEYDNAILVRFEAKLDIDLLPDHTHHALLDSLTRVHGLSMNLKERLFLVVSTRPLGWELCPVLFAISALLKKNWRKMKIYLLDTIKCRHKDIMRPSMEACGIDGFKTLENAGYDLRS